MENIYLILVIILFALAISDLIVGVSNDAVNFLNSAIGSKTASFKVIMAVASVGIFVGATYSTGMMEVARKGIFHPELFNFQEIMALFLAVMITNILLLDLFNTFGLPTSTTVSIVFGLLGAAVGIAWLKIHIDPTANQELSNYINSGKALQIIFGILLSVVVAFTVGAIVQWLSRWLFSFNYTKRFKYFGSLWGGIAITSITYFIILKGLKGSPYASHIMSDGTTLFHWAQNNAINILSVSLLIWTVILQILLFLKVNILKIIVLTGTFALALAFAGNDLVNFIGVPLAGFNAFNYWSAAGAPDPAIYDMAALTGKVPTEIYILVIASLVMVVTLLVSKKAKKVIKTSLDLSRQDEGEEKFGSSMMARNLVGVAIKTGETIDYIIPSFIKKSLTKQFDTQLMKKELAKQQDPPVFDMIRATVNLVVASILISIGTSFKLPLSTTYVTFMVAMGTSLADKAWGRESAVYRITGVLSVIGGWFFTALSAFTAAFIVAIIISWGSFYAIVVVLLLSLYLMYKFHITTKIKEEREENISRMNENIKDENILEQCTNNVHDTLYSVSDIYENLIIGIDTRDKKRLKEVTNEVKVLNIQAKTLKDNVYKVLKKLRKDSVSQSHHYAQVLDYLRETAHCFTYMSSPTLEYFENYHTPLIDVQINELKKVSRKFKIFNKFILSMIENSSFSQMDEALDQQESLLALIETYRKTQMKRLKHEEVGAKNSMLFLGLLHETKNLMLHIINLTKAQRDFVNNADN